MKFTSPIDLGNPNPERAFVSYIREFQPVAKDTLYSAPDKNVFSDFHRKKSTVYMIAKTKKMSFVIDSFRVIDDFCILGKVLVGGRTEDVMFNIAKLLFEKSGVTHKYDGWRSWADRVMSAWAIKEESHLSSSQKYRRGSRIDLDLSNETRLYIECMLYQSIGNGNTSRRVIVQPLDLAHMFDWYLLDDIEILYVGKSKSSVLNRAINHNKWGEITTDLKSDEFAFVYFMDIEQSSIMKESLGPISLITNTTDDELDRDSIALITEAALIKHFFSEEKYNREIVSQDIIAVKSVREKLIERGYTALRVDLILEGVFGVFGTKKTGITRSHIFQVPLKQL
ncbi:hypothetical protein [Rhodanobacter sp. MP1X3]|uniref:hypothetical protein n=1 Tax=Rhodanobacter sp. MP1X3 TaxID=2723086 RepID=UPI00161E364A|nr:hypothetical protein [Rhodanobacter sp. MP1X3]MBB6244114.1 hypothetical protein [Rhodanobacter sp. MP1X3]